ncbi:MAG: phosphate acyltransferase PlsX [Chloroflexota bacterium]|nr:phosphate acyltransferase PlsX [Chloroflexota bacterium]
MKIVLDAMGGDHAPEVAVEGAVRAARELDVEIPLVGQPEAVQSELAKHDTTGLYLPIIPASQVVEMDEHPAAAVRAKPDSSMVVGMELVKNKEAQALVSAGNSGGVLAAALFQLGRIQGIRRPALSSILPTRGGRCFFLDGGANTDCKPEYLLQFALMGSIYAQKVMEIENPRVGIVSNGEEEGKGNILVQETYQLLKESPLNFIGNVEGRDIFRDMADVVVTDGFTGNVIVKTSEGVATMLMEVLRKEIRKRPLAMLGTLLARPAFQAAAKLLDYREYGGGVLLGVKGVVIVAHGRSDAQAIASAMRLAKRAVEGEVVSAIQAGLAELTADPSRL